MKPKKSLEDRFFEKVEHRDGSDCWWWAGAHNGDSGRGCIQGLVTGRLVQATHASWYLFHGVWPNDAGLLVRHKVCDNPMCVNPDHLLLGTQSDNMNDCAEKGRDVGNTRLTADQVAEVHRRVEAGDTLTAIAADLGMTRQGISLVAFGKSIKADGGRIYRPANDKRKKLSDEQVEQIRERHNNGERVTALAREFGVRHSLISRIIGGTRRV